MSDISSIPTEQLMAMLHGGGGGDNAPPAPPPSPQDQARAAGMEAGRNENPVVAGLSQAARQYLPFSSYVGAAARYAGQRLTGVDHPDDFSTDLAYSRGQSEGEIEGHPVAGTIGGVAGGLGQGAAIGGALKGTRFADLLAAKGGSKLAQAGKTAAVGATVGGATSVNNGDSLPDTVRNTAISAAAAPVVGHLASFTLSKLQPAAARAMQALAERINETPQTLQNAYQNYQMLTGSTPSMAQLMGLKSQGMLRKFADGNPEIAQAAMTAADLGGRPLHEQLGALNAKGATMPQTAAELTARRDAKMDAHMNTPHPQSGLTLNETPVRDPQGLMVDPRVGYALFPNNRLDARLGNLGSQGLPPIMERIQNDQATIGDVETVRKALRDMQSELLSPRAGSLHARSPEQAKEFGDLAMKVEGLGRKTDPDYGLALDNYRNGSQYIDAFQHGLSGKAINDVSANDPMLQKALQSPAGIRGYQHGNALNTGQQALNAIAPGSVAPPSGGFGPGHVAQGAMAASSGGISMVYHTLRSIPVVGQRVPEKVQRIVAEQLYNPRTTQQGINNLQRAGVTAKDIRTVGAAIGGVAGQKIADYLSQKGQ